MGSSQKKNMITKKPLRSYYLVLSLVAVIVIVLASYFVVHIRQVTYQQGEHYLLEISQSIADKMNLNTNISLSELRITASNYIERKEAHGSVGDFLQKRGEALDFSFLSFMDMNGKCTNDKGQTFNFSNDDMIMEVLEGKEIITDSIGLKSYNQDGLIYGVPVYQNDEIIGGIIALESKEWINSLLAENYFDEQAYFHVIENDGTFVMKSNNDNDLMIGHNFFYELSNQSTLSQKQFQNIHDAIGKGQSGSFVFHQKNNKQNTQLVYYVPLLKDMSLIFMIDQHVALGPFQDLAFYSTIILLTIIILLTGVLLLVFINYRKNNTQLYETAYVDTVTQGYNQTRFRIEAGQLISTHPPLTYTFLILDISRFKLINDAFGYQGGNRLLKYIHDVIKVKLKDDEMICRIAADQFVILLHRHDESSIVELLDSSISQMNNFNKKLQEKYFLTFTIGAYMIDDPNLSVVFIQDRANVARKSKACSKNHPFYRLTFFAQAEHQRMLKEKDMENRMEEALTNREFVVYFQPKIELKSNRYVGGEALVRWLNPQKGLIPPDEFIPFFEENGFIIKLDLYVFECVCQHIRIWLDAKLTLVPISVNLSRAHLNNPHFLDNYILIQQKYNVPPHLIEIEITESLLSENLETVIWAIDKIHKAGFTCSLDDFGSGYSSLNMLSSINVDVIKLDRAFFKSLDMENNRERAIIETIIDMTKRLKMRTVSEGVESGLQLEFLKTIDCDMVQGYVVSKPVPVNEFEKMIFKERG
ncbi:bifunctional diguanylate cyclase/phosphodiesterase [Longibaculum muris]|uniref:bifunctional diguanylate cyclase/phosphodiesterase n=1 Tax=Longibaculum muris TaxID=1796628 RepID=UPI0022E8BCFC|nr:EAL domain-containing protein [Longibaculum muris]